MKALVMRLRWAAVLLMTSVCAWGQDYCAGGDPPKNDSKCIPASEAMMKPLKCGKYEHLEPATTTVTSPSGTVFQTQTYQHCAPDMHEVTEKEWQELQERLKALEKTLECYGKTCFAAGAGRE